MRYMKWRTDTENLNQMGNRIGEYKNKQYYNCFVKSIFSIPVILIFIVGMCACSRAEQDLSDKYRDELDNICTKESIEQQEKPTQQLREIDLFENVDLSFEGWNEVGCVSAINTDNCEYVIQEYVNFHIQEQEVDGQLYNGQRITIVAEYDEGLLEQEGYYYSGSKTKEYYVSTLREINAAHNYSEDVAWVRTKIEEESVWACVDLDGNILFSIPVRWGWSDNTDFTDFYMGVSLIDRRYLVDKNGNVVWNIDDTLDLLGKWYNIENVSLDGVANYYEGYIFVGFSVSSFEYEGELLIILDSNGNIYREPIECSDSFKYDEYSDKSGTCRIHTANGTEIYNICENKLSSEENIRGFELIEKSTEKRYYENHNGLKWVTQNSWVSGEDGVNTYFSDITGDKVIDLSGYKIINTPCFSDGYCALYVENVLGGWDYSVIIDTEGNEVLEPIKGKVGDVHDGIFKYNGEYMNLNGDLITSSEFDVMSNFNCGRAYVSWDGDNTLHFIDKEGHLIF